MTSLTLLEYQYVDYSVHVHPHCFYITLVHSFIFPRPQSTEYKQTWAEIKVLVDQHKSSLDPATPQLNICDDAVMVIINS